MRIAAVADLHGFLPPVPRCDLLVVAGDVCPTSSHDPAFQAEWLDSTFRTWLEAAPAAAILGIAGNHDFVFERAPELVPGDLPWTYLEDAGAEVAGLDVWGSPWTPWFYDWAFNAPREDGEPFLRERYAGAPPSADLVVLHGPPTGYGDLTATGARVGSPAALEMIERVEPALCVFGHIHEARGSWRHGPTRLENVAAVDLTYALREEPFALLDL